MGGMENRLDPELEVAQTRTEVLAGRGYSPEVVAGRNGHSNGHAELSVTRPAACTVCGGPVDARRAQAGSKTCSREQCVAEARNRRRRARPKPAEPPRMPAAARNGAPDTSSGSNGSVSTSGALLPLAANGGLAGHVEALCQAFGGNASIEIRSGPLTAVFVMTR